MAIDAVLKAVFLGAYSRMHGLIALMQYKLHVVAPHEVGVFHAFSGFLDNNDGLCHARRLLCGFIRFRVRAIHHGRGKKSCDGHDGK